MLTDFLQEQAALYSAGSLSPEEREDFELILEFHEELRAFTMGLLDVATAVALSALPAGGVPPTPGIKTRLGHQIASRPQHSTPDGLVASSPDGLVEWVNPAFSEMCGYTLEELRGKKLGPILQGAETNREVVSRIRRAVKECIPCRETILNYHKNGTPYWVDIAIRPIFDSAGKPLWLVARERELSEHAAA